jgi:hypothetical protein
MCCEIKQSPHNPQCSASTASTHTTLPKCKMLSPTAESEVIPWECINMITLVCMWISCILHNLLNETNYNIQYFYYLHCTLLYFLCVMTQNAETIKLNIYKQNVQYSSVCCHVYKAAANKRVFDIKLQYISTSNNAFRPPSSGLWHNVCMSWVTDAFQRYQVLPVTSNHPPEYTMS